MPRFLSILLLQCFLAGAAWAVEPGQNAPGFELPGRQGMLHLSDAKGKTVYLDFWASWCGPCRQSFAWLNDMQKRYADRGLQVIGVNVDQDSRDAREFLKAHPASFEIAFDDTGKVPRAYAIKGMPTSILIGPDGKVRGIHNGFKNDYRQEREQDIRRSLGLTETP